MSSLRIIAAVLTARICARRDLDLDRATLAKWVGGAFRPHPVNGGGPRSQARPDLTEVLARRSHWVRAVALVSADSLHRRRLHRDQFQCRRACISPIVLNCKSILFVGSVGNGEQWVIIASPIETSTLIGVSGTPLLPTSSPRFSLTTRITKSMICCVESILLRKVYNMRPENAPLLASPTFPLTPIAGRFAPLDLRARQDDLSANGNR